MNKQTLIYTCTLALTLFTLMSASPMHAAEGDAPISLRASGRYTASADVGDGDGSMGSTSERFDLRWKYLSLSYTQTQFQWDNVNALGFGNGQDDPWDTFHRIAIGTNFRGKINKTWFYHTGLTLTSAFEDEMDNSYGGALRGGVGYAFNKNVTALFGVAVMHNALRTTAMPSAAVALNYLESDGSGWTANLGFPSINTVYHFDTASALRLEVAPNSQTVRLADDSTVAQKGYTSLSGWRSGFYYDWKPSKTFSLSVGPEYTFARSTTIYSHTGDKLYDESDDNALGAGLRFRIRF